MKKVFNVKGFTLIEVLAVIVILGILVAIAVLSVIGLVRKAEEDVCVANRRQFERSYLMLHNLESLPESNMDFKDYLLNNGKGICPSGGEISYEYGVLNCEIHSNPNDGKDDGGEDEDVPYL